MPDPTIETYLTQPSSKMDSFVETKQDVGALVLKAPESVWERIKKILKVQTREEAAGLVKADDKARQLVLPLLLGTDAETQQTRTPLAEQMYSSKKANVEF